MKSRGGDAVVYSEKFGARARASRVLLLAAALLALAGCVDESRLVSSSGRWEPIPDPVSGRVERCCWYPHGYYRWVPDSSGVAPDRVQER